MSASPSEKSGILKKAKNKNSKAMPKYLYVAKNAQTGETVTGEQIAENEHDLAQILRTAGALLVSTKEITEHRKVRGKFFSSFRGIPLKEKMLFTRNLAVMVSSGLPIPRAIQNLSVQTKNKRFQVILNEVFSDLQGGMSLAESLAGHAGVFDELFVNMIAVGEVSGSLEEVLDILATQLEKDHDLLSKVRGALVYPAVILFAMTAVGILMLTYILPKITGVFKEMNVTLPATTLFIMAVSDFLIRHWFLAITLVVVLVFGIRWFAKTALGKRAFGKLYLYLPILGPIVVKVNCARFARIYSSLLSSGVPVLKALEIIERTLTNVHYRAAMRTAMEGIQKGVNLSDVLLRYPRLFPVLVPQIIQVGEETGKTELVLSRLAEFYEEEVSQVTKNMSSIIEPVLMLIIGCGVGFFAVAMLQPMYSVLENIK
jgi:type IV pilus assembly protein PilC